VEKKKKEKNERKKKTRVILTEGEKSHVLEKKLRVREKGEERRGGGEGVAKQTPGCRTGKGGVRRGEIRQGGPEEQAVIRKEFPERARKRTSTERDGFICVRYRKNTLMAGGTNAIEYSAV